MIQITLENLGNMMVRATGRQDGRTIKYFDGPKNERKRLVQQALKAAASAHEIQDGRYDMTYIQMNDAAKAVM